MTPNESGGRNTMIIAVVAILIVAAIAVWATKQRQPAGKPAGTSASVTVGDKDADVNLKVDLPDSVTIDAH